MELIAYFQEMWHLAMNRNAQGVFFWFSLYIFVVGVYSVIFQVRTRYWPFTYGDLAELSLGKFDVPAASSDRSYMTEALYHYNVSGVNYSGTRVSPWVIMLSYNLRFILKKQMSYVQYSGDGKVKVFYNPSNPKKSFLIIAGKVGVFITFLLSILPFVLFYCEYYVYRA